MASKKRFGNSKKVDAMLKCLSELRFRNFAYNLHTVSFTDPTHPPLNCTGTVKFEKRAEMARNIRRRILSGDNVDLNCKATGDPDPRIKWYKNGKPFSRFGNDPEKVDAYQYVLSIRHFAIADKGEYTCNVSNGCSWSNFTYHLDIKGA